MDSGDEYPARVYNIQMKKLLIILAYLIVFTFPAHAALIDSSRLVTWQGNVGTANTIPSAGTVRNCVDLAGVVGDGATDDAAAILHCLSDHVAAGEVAYLPAGTYAIKSDIVVPSNKVLRGAGMGVTTIKGIATYTYTWGLVGFNQSNSFSASINISGSPAKGDTSLTTAADHSLTTGDYVVIDELDNAAGDPPVTNTGDEGQLVTGRTSTRSKGQVAKVASTPTGTSFTIDIPLYWSYSSTPQVTKINGMTVNAGVESLTIDNSVVKVDHAGLMWYAADSWFYKVEVNYTDREGISLLGYRNTIHGCKVHETVTPLGSNSGYGIWIQGVASANLIENNIIYNTSNPIIINGEVSGNVIAYNYLEAHMSNTGRQNGAFSSHGAHPMMNLVEGNSLIGGTSLDFTWGSSSHYTFYRNRMELQQPLTTYSQYRYLIDIRQKNHYHNIVGNMLWTSGDSGTYEKYAAPDLTVEEINLYTLGFKSDGTGDFSDTAVRSTLYRHGNYDYVNSSQQWDAGNEDHTLSSSLYLSTNPSSAWWCTQSVFPSVNPATPSYSKIPAQITYEEGTCTLGSSAYTLTITKAGTGSVTITSDALGIDCGDDCTEDYSGTTVTLTATHADNKTHTWSGDGTGTTTRVVTISAAKAITCTVSNLTGQGTLGGSGGATLGGSGTATITR